MQRKKKNLTTLTKPVYEIDQETRLPALPEGLFWRVGNSEEYTDRGYRRTVTGVSLMEKQEPVIEEKKVPVYGVNWLGNQKKNPDYYDTEMELVEREPLEIGFERFEGRNAYKKEHIPEMAVNVREAGNYGRDEWKYTVPLSKEGIAFLADVIWITRLRREEHQKRVDREAAERKAIQDKFFGDYPPKTLVDA